MRFGRQFLDNLRNRVAISSVVGNYVKLKHKGRGEFTGLCPFHKEKTPSFSVSDPKGFYHCFGCGVHGDVIRFLTDYRGLPYVEAVKELASQAGMELPKNDYYNPAQEKKIEDSYEVLEIATKWFEANLDSAAGMAARNYLKERGLTNETIKKFRLGYAPDSWDGLKNHLKSKGVDDEIIAANGLLAANEDNTRHYDRFRDRIIFPIFSAYGKVIAFGGRIMNKEASGPKYLNSPETDLFKKGYTLYGFNYAKDRAYKEEKIIAVEGYMDVIALHQAGFNYAVAPLGTALTENHLKSLWKITKEPTMCMDGDDAGIRASKKFAEEYISLLEPGYTIKFAFVPKGYDPDEFIKENGADAFEKILQSATPLSETLWQLNIAQAKLDTPEQRSDFANKMMKIVETIQNPSVKNFYKGDYSARIYALGKINNAKAPQKLVQFTPELKSSLSKNISRLEKVRERLILLAAYNPDLALRGEVEEVLNMVELDNKLVEKLAENVITFCAESDDVTGDKINYTGLLSYLEKKGGNHQIEYLKNNSAKDEFIWSEEPQAKSIFAWRYLLAEYYLALAEKEYDKLLGGSEMDISLLYEQQQELQGRIISLKRARDEKRNEFENVTGENNI